VAAVLAEHFGSMHAIQQASTAELASVNEVGPTIAESVHAFVTGPYGAACIADLASVGVRMERDGPPAHKKGGALAGKTVVVTGTLVNYTRDEIHALVERHGGRAAGSVSGATDYLVAGEKAGSKQQKAEKLGVPVLSEAEFEALLDGKE
jgi:DNA ligase (NAD+)